MKATLIAEAIVLLAVIAISQSLPLGSSNPEVAQSVIPLTDLPKEVPAEKVDAVKAEIKPEESEATPEPEKKIKEVKAAEPEPQLIDQAAILTPAVQDEPKEIIAVVEAESAVIKEEPAAPVRAIDSRGSEEPEAPKLEEAAPAPALIPEAEKPAAEEDSSKGLTGETLQGKPEAARSTDEVIPKEQPENLKEELKVESAPIEKEAAAEIPQAKEIKEEVIAAEIATSSAPVVDEIVKDKDAKKSDDLVAAAVAGSSEERSRSGSEIEGDKPLEQKEEKEPKKEDSALVAETESRLKEDEEVLEKEEEKKEVKEEVKKVEPAAEEPKEESIKAEQLPEAQKLEEQAKKPEDSKESSEESKESEERSPEKDKNGVKNEEDSSQEQSDEEPEKTKAS